MILYSPSNETSESGAKILLYGGSDSINCFGDMYLYDLKSCNWELITTTGQIPSPRTNHTLTFVEPSYLVLLGSEKQPMHREGNDLFMYDIHTKQWQNSFSKSDNHIQKQRTAHTTVLWSTELSTESDWKSLSRYRLIVFGGYAGANMWLDDLLLLTVTLRDPRMAFSSQSSDSTVPLLDITNSILMKERSNNSQGTERDGSSQQTKLEQKPLTKIPKLVKKRKRRDDLPMSQMTDLGQEQKRQFEISESELCSNELMASGSSDKDCHVHCLERSNLLLINQVLLEKVRYLEKHIQGNKSGIEKPTDQIPNQTHVLNNGFLENMVSQIISKLSVVTEMSASKIFDTSYLIENKLSLIQDVLEDIRHTFDETTELEEDSPDKASRYA